MIEAEDMEDYPLLGNHWEEAHAFLQQGREEKTLVHCSGGWNRSVLILAAECLIRQQQDKIQTDVMEIVKHIRQCRGNGALHNGGFQRQLVAFARQHDLLGPKPET